jgi:Cys-tRNA(Pro)/Cys-tRNA(Cys) deacylase
VTGGLRRRLPVVIESSALEYPALFCSAGQRRLEPEIAPGAELAAIEKA